MPSATKGAFVKSSNNRLGIGKLMALSGQTAAVQYFLSTSKTLQKLVPTKSLELTRLRNQTRCYLRGDDESSWLMGRIGKYVDGEYEVNLPNYHARYVPESEVFVRCRLPIEDPTDVLAARAHETPFFYRRRLEFVRYLSTQRAVFRGLPGLASSRVELFPHQVDIVSRVLLDPVQRYLLADEVGLGKTVEAGIILRQILLDQPEGRVLILVPPSIVDQWREELEEKFTFGLTGEIEVQTTDRLLQMNSEPWDLMIVDEAQSIAALAWSPEKESHHIFDRFMTVSQGARRLLLLSATPVLNNERDFLAVLHMLDPMAFHLEDFEEFRVRVSKRQEVGRTLLSLREGMHTVPLQAALKSLRENFEGDLILDGLAAQLENMVATSSSLDQRNETIRAIRIHVSETYRLHRRMLRNRRRNLQDVLFGGRQEIKQGSKSVVAEIDTDERLEHVLELLENWRTSALGALLDSPNITWEEQLRDIYFLLIELADASLSLLNTAAHVRLKEGHSRNSAGELAGQAKRLSGCPLFPGEDSLLTDLIRITGRPSEDGDRIHLLVDVVRRHRRRQKNKATKTVVFTSSRSVCHEVVRLLRTTFGTNAVVTFFGGQPPDQVEDNMDAFRERSSGSDILVCDRAGEVGRNLQFADVLIHLDLPWNPNRIEQRIGRLDRIGRKQPFTSHVFTGPDVVGTVMEAWFTILAEGFRVFRESIAALQMFVDSEMPRLRTALWEGGPGGLLSKLPDLAVELRQEELQIAEQDALDFIESSRSEDREFFQAADALDSESSSLEKQFDAWVVDTLQFKRNPIDKVPGAYYYEPTYSTLVPLDLLAGTGGNAPLATSLLEPRTFRRQTAVANAGVGLLRIGDPFVDALSDYIQWDDRGKACAYWRHLPGWGPSETADWSGFRFVYLVGADCAQAIATARRLLRNSHDAALLRRGDLLFPPLLVDWILDIEGNHITDEKLLEAIKMPFKSGELGSRDSNLAKERLPILNRLIDSTRWPELCRTLRAVSETQMRESAEFHQHIERCAEVASRELQTQIHSLKLRIRELTRKASPLAAFEEKELEAQQCLAQDFLAGIRSPLVRLDSIAFCVLSGRQCPAA